MDGFRWGVLAAVWCLTFLPGVVALWTGRLVYPWLKAQIPAPRMWGCSVICLGIAATISIVARASVGGEVGALSFASAFLVLSLLSRRLGRETRDKQP